MKHMYGKFMGTLHEANSCHSSSTETSAKPPRFTPPKIHEQIIQACFPCKPSTLKTVYPSYIAARPLRLDTSLGTRIHPSALLVLCRHVATQTSNPKAPEHGHSAKYTFQNLKRLDRLPSAFKHAAQHRTIISRSPT